MSSPCSRQRLPLTPIRFSKISVSVSLQITAAACDHSFHRQEVVPLVFQVDGEGLSDDPREQKGFSWVTCFSRLSRLLRQVPCSLEYWDELQQAFVPYREFSLSESRTCQLQLPSLSLTSQQKELVASDLWRIVLNNNGDGGDEQRWASVALCSTVCVFYFLFRLCWCGAFIYYSHTNVTRIKNIWAVQCYEGRKNAHPDHWAQRASNVSLAPHLVRRSRERAWKAFRSA